MAAAPLRVPLPEQVPRYPAQLIGFILSCTVTTGEVTLLTITRSN